MLNQTFDADDARLKVILQINWAIFLYSREQGFYIRNATNMATATFSRHNVRDVSTAADEAVIPCDTTSNVHTTVASVLDQDHFIPITLVFQLILETVIFSIFFKNTINTDTQV